jgi:hypothetical protein
MNPADFAGERGTHIGGTATGWRRLSGGLVSEMVTPDRGTAGTTIFGFGPGRLRGTVRFSRIHPASS